MAETGVPLSPRDSTERFARRLSVALLAILTLASLVRFRDLYPLFIDVNYHMGAIEGMRQAGGLVLWDFWELAPAGRAHVYPPALHVAGRLACLAGFSPWGFVTFVSWTMWPLSLVVTWLLARRLTGERGALLAVAFLAGPYQWFFCQAALTANAVALVLALAAILSYLNGRYLAAGVAAFLAAATHGAGLVGVATIVVASIPHPRLLVRRALPILAGVLGAYAPWLLHMAKHTATTEARFEGLLNLDRFRLDFVLLPLALAGAVLLVRRAVRLRRAGDRDGAVRAAALPAFLVPFAVMFPWGYAHRFWTSNCLLPYSLLAAAAAAMALEWLGERARDSEAAGGGTLRERLVAALASTPEVSLVAIAMAAMMFVPVWQPSRAAPAPVGGRQADVKDVRAARGPGMRARGGFRFETPAVASILSGSGARRMPRGGGGRELTTFLDVAAGEVGPGHLVFASGPDGPLVTALTGARTTGGMLSEVKSPAPPAEPGECDFYLDPGMSRRPMPGGGGRRGPGGGVAVPPGFVEVHLDGVDNVEPASRVRSPGPGGMPPAPTPRLYRNTRASPERLGPPRAAVPTLVLLLGALGLAALVVADLGSARLSELSRTGALAGGAAGAFVLWMWLGAKVVVEDPSARPEWAGEGSLHARPKGGIGGRPGMGPPRPGVGGMSTMALPPDVPSGLAGRVRKLHETLRRVSDLGASPDYFWPRSRARAFRQLLGEGRFDEA
ncbi:MAG: hypothetical protein ACYTKD_03690, partial [Planctomycetota bacterium]